MSGPRLLSCQQERGCQDSEMTSANRMERKWHHQTRMSKERIVREKKTSRPNSRQQEGLSRFKDDKGKPDQETVAASDKDAESKKCQGQRLPRNHRVNGRASQAVGGCSYRLSIVFIGFSLYRKFRHPACPGSICIYSYCGVYIHIHIYIRPLGAFKLQLRGPILHRCCFIKGSWEAILPCYGRR